MIYEDGRLPEAIFKRPQNGPVVTKRNVAQEARKAKAPCTVKQEFDPYSGPSSLHLTLPGEGYVVAGEGFGELVVGEAFSVEETIIGGEEDAKSPVPADQGDPEDWMQDEGAPSSAIQVLHQSENDKDSDTLSNADSTVGKRGEGEGREGREEGARQKDGVRRGKRALRSVKKVMMSDEEGSGYESVGDEDTWTKQRKSEKMRRYNRRKQLVNPGEVEVPGAKEISEEFCSFMINNKERAQGTAKSYASTLFHRKDNKSLLSYLSGINDNFHAANLTNFEDDTGAYVLAPAPTDWVYAVLPSHDPVFSSQQ